jgi:hypothetical protein
VPGVRDWRVVTHHAGFSMWLRPQLSKYLGVLREVARVQQGARLRLRLSTVKQLSRIAQLEQEPAFRTSGLALSQKDRAAALPDPGPSEHSWPKAGSTVGPWSDPTVVPTHLVLARVRGHRTRAQYCPYSRSLAHPTLFWVLTQY